MTTAVTDTVGTTPRQRRLFAVNAGLAWAGLAVSFILMATHAYPWTPPVPSSYGWNGDGLAGFLGRLFDWVSYFTILSNVVVAVVMTMLARGRGRDSAVFRVLRLDSLLMISVTGIVYAVVLAPAADVRGWENLSNALLHYITPVVTVVVWLIAGPRGWITLRTAVLALVVPITWAAYTLLRGAIINAYPYGFIDVVRYGYASVLTSIAGIAVFGFAIGLVYLLIDRLLTRRTR